MFHMLFVKMQFGFVASVGFAQWVLQKIYVDGFVCTYKKEAEFIRFLKRQRQ